MYVVKGEYVKFNLYVTGFNIMFFDRKYFFNVNKISENKCI